MPIQPHKPIAPTNVATIKASPTITRTAWSILPTFAFMTKLLLLMKCDSDWSGHGFRCTFVIHQKCRHRAAIYNLCESLLHEDWASYCRACSTSAINQNWTWFFQIGKRIDFFLKLVVRNVHSAFKVTCQKFLGRSHIEDKWWLHVIISDQRIRKVVRSLHCSSYSDSTFLTSSQCNGIYGLAVPTKILV